MMSTVIRKSNLYLKSLENALLDYEKWGFSFVCSDRMRLVRNTVLKDVGLAG